MTYVSVCLLALCVLFMKTDGLLQSRDLPIEMAKCLNRFYSSCTIEEEVGLSILHNCIQEYKWKPNRERQYPEKRLSPEGQRYLEGLTRKVRSLHTSRGKRQAAVRRRKEYRMLSANERARYHNAVRRLKQSTVNTIFEYCHHLKILSNLSLYRDACIILSDLYHIELHVRSYFYCRVGNQAVMIRYPLFILVILNKLLTLDVILLDSIENI